MGEVPSPSFPGLPHKHLLPAVIDPAEHAAYACTRWGATDLREASGAVLVYQRSLRAYALRKYAAQAREHWISGDLHLLAGEGGSIALCSGFGRGAPAAGLIIEQLGAFGIRAVISVGTAAALRSDQVPGTIVVCIRAVRDEGLSYHYQPPGHFAYPSPGLTARLAATISQNSRPAHQGATWTTDALYRETEEEAIHYGKAGVMTCDMEAAGVFAVAQHRQMEAAAAFAVADSLLNREPRTDGREIGSGLEAILDAAVRTLLETPPAKAGLPAPCTARPGPMARKGPAVAGNRPSNPGVFVAVEGADGSGKSAVVSELVELLRRDGRHVKRVLRSSPAGPAAYAGLVRGVDGLFRAGWEIPVSWELLSLAAAAQYLAIMQSEIGPSVAAGTIVIAESWWNKTWIRLAIEADICRGNGQAERRRFRNWQRGLVPVPLLEGDQQFTVVLEATTADRVRWYERGGRRELVYDEHGTLSRDPAVFGAFTEGIAAELRELAEERRWPILRNSGTLSPAEVARKMQALIYDRLHPGLGNEPGHPAPVPGWLP
jgi:uridine phosphorylase